MTMVLFALAFGLIGFCCALLLVVWHLADVIRAFKRPEQPQTYVPEDCDHLALIFDAFDIARSRGGGHG